MALKKIEGKVNPLKALKEIVEDGLLENRFCESYKYFFERNIEKMMQVAEYIIKIRKENFLKNK